MNFFDKRFPHPSRTRGRLLYQQILVSQIGASATSQYRWVTHEGMLHARAKGGATYTLLALSVYCCGCP